MTAATRAENALKQATGLRKQIGALRHKQTRTQAEDRRLADAYRLALRAYQDTVCALPPTADRGSDEQCQKLVGLAREAFLYLGGQGEPSCTSLKDYDHRTFGPYLGVSDEGSAGQVIRSAAMKSPKARLLKKIEPISVGVSLDAERLGAAGEVAVGPKEYADVYLQSTGQILTSTNVGTRLNVRYYLNYPVVVVPAGPVRQSIDAAKKDLAQKFRPFLATPNRVPRPITVYVKFEPRARRTVPTKVAILKELAAYASAGEVADPNAHHLGLQQPIRHGMTGQKAALVGVDIAARAGVRHVAIEGIQRREAAKNVSYPGLLDYLAPVFVDRVLRYAARKGIHIHPVNVIDTETIARNVWSSLATARHMGLALGKYGTFPLTLKECDVVVGQIQTWFQDWTAAPVFFVDQGVLTDTRVFLGPDMIAGIQQWLDVVSHRGVKVVLIDTMEKSKGIRLLRTKDEPKGLLDPSHVRAVDEAAAQRGIKALWAGGITIPQVFEFGRLGVFGIYVTTAVAAAQPVSKAYSKDPLLVAEKEPTLEGVYRVKLLLEAGFLSSRPECRRHWKDLESVADLLSHGITAGRPQSEVEDSEKRLDELVTTAWTCYSRRRHVLASKFK